MAKLFSNPGFQISLPTLDLPSAFEKPIYSPYSDFSEESSLMTLLNLGLTFRCHCSPIYSLTISDHNLYIISHLCIC